MLALPVSQREKVSTESRYGGRGQSLITPVAQLAAAIAEAKTGGPSPIREISRLPKTRKTASAGSALKCSR